MHLTLIQAAAWVAPAAGAWAIVRAGTAMSVLKARTPARCAACGRQKVWGQCPCSR